MCNDFDLQDGPGESRYEEESPRGVKVHLNIQGTSATSNTIQVEEFKLEFEGVTYIGYMSFKKSYVENGVKAPLCMIFPNYAGVKEWDIDQAMFIAKLGYVGLVVDLFSSTSNYPNEEKVRNPGPRASKKEKMNHLVNAFSAYNKVLRTPKHWRSLMSLYLLKARQHPVVHERFAAAIGYCFGGQCVLEMVRNGDDLQGVASFHGVLQSTPLKEPLDFASGKKFGFQPLPEPERPVNKHNKDCRILILNGDLDAEVSASSIAEFKKEMQDNAIKDWQLHTYSNTHHGFALGEKVWSNHYNVESDRRSTLSLLSFFGELWGDADFAPKVIDTPMNANGTVLVPSSL